MYNVVKLENPFATTCIVLYDCDGFYIEVKMNTCSFFEAKVIDDLCDFHLDIYIWDLNMYTITKINYMS